MHRYAAEGPPNLWSKLALGKCQVSAIGAPRKDADDERHKADIVRQAKGRRDLRTQHQNISAAYH